MAAKPKRKQPCPLCRQPMRWFGDHWVCINIKAHDRAGNPRGSNVLPFRRVRKNG